MGAPCRLASSAPEFSRTVAHFEANLIMPRPIAGEKSPRHTLTSIHGLLSPVILAVEFACTSPARLIVKVGRFGRIQPPLLNSPSREVQSRQALPRGHRRLRSFRASRHFPSASVATMPGGVRQERVLHLARLPALVVWPFLRGQP